MQDQLQKIREVKRSHENQWLKIDGVVAIGIGRTAAGEMGILISTKGNPERLRNKIPARVENIPIEIQHTGEIKAL